MLDVWHCHSTRKLSDYIISRYVILASSTDSKAFQLCYYMLIYDLDTVIWLESVTVVLYVDIWPWHRHPDRKLSTYVICWSLTLTSSTDSEAFQLCHMWSWHRHPTRKLINYVICIYVTLTLSSDWKAFQLYYVLICDLGTVIWLDSNCNYVIDFDTSIRSPAMLNSSRKYTIALLQCSTEIQWLWKWMKALFAQCNVEILNVTLMSSQY